MNSIKFFKESLKNIRTIGTLTRSSKFLCQKMISFIDFSKARLIVELGAGDGVITRYILKEMHPDARLMSFEVNEKFCKVLRKIHDPRLIIVEDSAENLKAHLEKNNFQKIDFVISALPIVVLPEETGINIINRCKENLAEGGLYIQVNYSLFAKNLYEDIFGNVDLNFEPRNVPPAFVFVSQKRNQI